MPKKYTSEQFWKLYEKLPQELKGAIFSEETAESILDICSRNGIEDERISEIARHIGRVLLGILPPTDFQETLEEELSLEREIAKGISEEVERYIFHPVKAELEEIYKIEVAPPARPTGVAPPPEEKPLAASRRDIYREPIG